MQAQLTQHVHEQQETLLTQQVQHFVVQDVTRQRQ
jgi:hypothetical protein